jgi:16S rRNA (guanine527-N7)-methyltransferase
MSMDRARIAALLEPFLDHPLSPAQLDQISTYIDLLLRWNARINLTAIRDPEQIVPRHFGESLFMARHLFPAGTTRTGVAPTEGAPLIAPDAMSGDSITAEDRSEREARGSKLIHVVDLGSGAGFPALPIKIWAPDIHLTMIESNQKKAAFLREATRALKLTNVDVIAERAESIAARLPSTVDLAGRNQKNAFQPAEVVTFRAVEKFNEILPTAKRFLAPNARLAVLITETQLTPLRALAQTTWTIMHVPESQQRLLAIA